jgi:hypothetical protein
MTRAIVSQESKRALEKKERSKNTMTFPSEETPSQLSLEGMTFPAPIPKEGKRRPFIDTW